MNLSIISPGFFVLLAFLTAGIWLTVILLHRKRRGVALRALAVFAALVITLATVADSVNAHYQYLPRLGDVVGFRTWPTVSRSTVLSLSPASTSRGIVGRTATRPGFADASNSGSHAGVTSIRITTASGGVQTDGARSALVWLPTEYFTQPTRRFPVAYLLHGSPGIPTDWLRGGGAVGAAQATDTAGHPMIVVMPQVSRNWLDDSECVNGWHEHVETYLINDVVPSIDRQLRTTSNRDGRAIAGLSAGGYCALNLGIRHRDLFSSIIDMSGYDHPTYSGGMRSLFGPVANLDSVIAANTPADYLARHPQGPPMAVWLGSGTHDLTVLSETRHMEVVLENYGIPAQVHTRPGGHTYGVWKPQLRQALSWLGDRFWPGVPSVPAPAASGPQVSVQ